MRVLVLVLRLRVVILVLVGIVLLLCRAGAVRTERTIPNGVAGRIDLRCRVVLEPGVVEVFGGAFGRVAILILGFAIAIVVAGRLVLVDRLV